MEYIPEVTFEKVEDLVPQPGSLPGGAVIMATGIDFVATKKAPKKRSKKQKEKY